MPFNIQSFALNGLAFGGARPTLFDVQITLPTSFTAGNLDAVQKLQFTCSATQLPSSIIGVIDVPYFGRKIKLAGDRVFEDWNVSIMNDEDFLVRDTMESWHTEINSLAGNLLSTGFDLNTYKASIATISQYGKDGSTIKQYNMINLFPVQVGSINVDWNSTNTIENFNVTFAYDYWEPVNVASGVTYSL